VPDFETPLGNKSPCKSMSPILEASSFDEETQRESQRKRPRTDEQKIITVIDDVERYAKIKE
jgi:hypothetical protein